MKKKIYLATLVLTIACAMVGCGKKEKQETTEADVKSDVVEFVNEELPGIKTSVDQAVGVYNAYFAAEEKPELAEFKSQLETDAIPVMETAIVDLNAVEVATTEVTELKSLYLQSIQKEFEAMKMVVSAIDGENADYLTQADGLIAESQELMNQYQTKLQTLAGEQGIAVTQ